MKSDQDRFEGKVFYDTAGTGCWLWGGPWDKDGYGHYRADGKQWRAHRWSYTHFVGEIPDGLQIDHLCRVRCCVNPEHLEPVTPKENSRRGELGPKPSERCRSGRHLLAKTRVFRKNGKTFCGVCHRAYWDGFNRKRQASRRNA